MTRSDFASFSVKLKGLYGDRFPGFPKDMARLWLEALRPIEDDLVLEALERWARHFTFKVPSLDELLEQVEMLRDEHHRLVTRMGSSTKSWLDVLREAQATEAANPIRTADDVTYGSLMVILTERSLDRWQDAQGVWHAKLTKTQRQQQCNAWASEYQARRPVLADDLRHAMHHFRAEDDSCPT